MPSSTRCRSMARPTLFTFFALFSTLLLWPQPISARNVHKHLLYSDLSQLSLDSLDEWAGVQGFGLSVHAGLEPTPSRRQDDPKASGHPAAVLSAPWSTPTVAPRFNPAEDSNRLLRRATFSTNVCPISIQTTVYISVDGTSTLTLSSVVGPRPTGIPGDAGTSDGTDPTGGQPGSGTESGQSFVNKEGLITGLVIVALILLASFFALAWYFYKKRKNARLQRLSVSPNSDAAEIVRRMGSKGLMSLSNSARSFSRSRAWLSRLRWSPVPFFTGLIARMKPGPKSAPERDSQSSELLEWKRKVNTGVDNWSVVEDQPRNERIDEKLTDVPTEKRGSGGTIPEVISSPPLSPLFPTLPNLATTSGDASPNTSTNYVPLVNRRLSPHLHPQRRSGLQSIVVEPLPGTSSAQPARDASPLRNSRGEPLGPSAWMAGFGLAPGANVDPFIGGSNVSSSEHQSRISEPTSPLSAVYSSASDRTPRARPISPLPAVDRLSTVGEGDMGDGASDIISTFGSAFGDRPGSTHTLSTMNDERRHSGPSGHFQHYHPLSDVEEVLTPVADERLSMQPGNAPFVWREDRDSFGQLAGVRGHHLSASPDGRLAGRVSAVPSGVPALVNPFADDASPTASSPSPTFTRGRRPLPPRRKSEAMSLQGGFLPSEKSASISLTGTSILDPAAPINPADWDDAVARREEEDRLFYASSTRPGTAASNPISSSRHSTGHP